MRLAILLVATACERVEPPSPAPSPPTPTPTPSPTREAVDAGTVAAAVFCAHDHDYVLCYSSREQCTWLHKNLCQGTVAPQWHCKTGTPSDNPAGVVENCRPTRALCEAAPVGTPDLVQSGCTPARPVWCTGRDDFLMCYSTRKYCDAIQSKMAELEPPGRGPSPCEPR